MQNDEIMESHPVCTTLLEFMEDKIEWAGKPTELYLELTKTAEKCGQARSSLWPKAPNKLSEKLKELKHNLLQAGFQISHDRENTFKRTRIIMISKTGTIPGGPSGTVRIVHASKGR